MTENNTNWNIISNKSNDKYVFVVVRVPSDDTEKIIMMLQISQKN